MSVFARNRALLAELTLVSVLLFVGPFSAVRLVLLLLLASQSLWLRNSGWRDVGLQRSDSLARTVLIATGGAVVILLASRLVILPAIELLIGEQPDLSALGGPRDTSALVRWMLQAWTLAAFGEEMVFRGYLLHRLTKPSALRRVGGVLQSCSEE
jgi:uncharacterized protein